MIRGSICEYFERYGNSGVPGECSKLALLVLVESDVKPPIRVCHEHARVIVSRFPELGDVEKRFRPI